MSDKYDLEQRIKELHKRFKIADEFTEHEYSEGNNGAGHFVWKNTANGQKISVFTHNETVYRYFHHIPLDESSHGIRILERGVLISDAVKMFTEDFLKKMFPDDYGMLVLNCKKTSGLETDSYTYLRLEYEQVTEGRYVYSYGATVKLRVYKDNMLVEECSGSIAHFDRCDALLNLTQEDYIKAFPLKLSYEKFYGKGTVAVYSSEIGFLSEVDNLVLDTRHKAVSIKTHGYEVEDNTYYETDEKVLAQMVQIDEKTAYDIIFENTSLRHVFIEDKNNLFLPAVTLESNEPCHGYKIVLDATEGKLIGAAD